MRVARPRNPVLDRELKERLRTRRATLVITTYLGVLALLLYAIYESQATSSTSGFGGPVASQAATVGRTMFDSLVLVVLGLVLLIVPGQTADAITGERERQTLVPLQVTLLRPRAIIGGKLLSTLAFVALLVVSTLPLVGISFILGGVTLGHVARAVAAVLATGLLVACTSLLCSSLARRTQGAMVLAHGLALFLAVGGPVVYGVQRALDDEGPHPAPVVLVLNPFLAAADAISPVGDAEDRFGGASSPLAEMSRFVWDAETSGFDADVGGVAGLGGGGFVAFEDQAVATTVVDDGVEVDPLVAEPLVAQAAPARTGIERIPFWLRSTVVLGAVAAASFVLAARRIATPSDRAAT